MSDEIILKTKNLHKRYAEGTSMEVHALRGIDIEIKKGEMVAIMGPSGCGKTTLLNLLGGIDQPSEGTIYINNQDINQLTDIEVTEFRLHNIGYIFQLFNLFEFLSALDNTVLPLLLTNITKLEAEEEAKMMLRQMGLGDKIFHLPNELSGGEQQRVAVSRALLMNPAIILGDEPTGDLDQDTSTDIMNLFVSINENYKQTFLVVTHSEHIAKFCHRIIRIVDGEIVDDGKQVEK
ncbi:MAG: ABC transporter ATP-binding protein [Candidatus Heimdallarchaeota archaeon]|nr:ABC transporter ATP-binding protein [Candidatus Heimdallarchaeota archaeon]MCG3256861.1 ABC transporter ATP-binding protein [Candidatus Heimdallarchaeota archaeon]MCK4611925.1 ABC transporter ATP-binding protein [Candidatus Heimdallarchaeota archaeon]